MTSETRIRYGSRVRRQGSFRPFGPVPGQQQALEPANGGGRRRTGAAFLASETFSRRVPLQSMARWKPIRKLRRWIIAECTRLLTKPLASYVQRVPNNIDKLKKTLRKGDVLLVEGDQRISQVIRYLTQSSLVALRALRRRRAAQGRSGARRRAARALRRRGAAPPDRGRGRRGRLRQPALQVPALQHPHLPAAGPAPRRRRRRASATSSPISACATTCATSSSWRVSSSRSASCRAAGGAPR